ncbi:MAG: zinc-binding dehydrogenase [Alphaproteobacteria bacterium]|jgi:NADPH:quinone reductase|nr:zinc-binding dehydrogenase [Alphaproteobacteria bacterium]MBT4085916.1 zinc-binding dehydrogenase [Alphaproteobacteria bacterium]MBT4542611.1 zinc-binding dehydrogenase [Alphaproteobacteria bacterium]MBT7746815.1 zinc-binding dehydrogenase [Alphaproteobacteria bacterium]
MRAVFVDAPGDLDALVIKDVPDPQPGPEDVLIEVAYAGCNWADTQVRSGIYPHPPEYPCVPGFEVSGKVLATGDAVSGLSAGDRVVAIPPLGGYAQKCLAPAATVYKLPDDIAMDVGAAFQIQALTAYHMLHTVYRLKKDDVVLVHAAGGGVGLLAIQLAVKAGARVIGTVGTRGKEQKALAYGAEVVVNNKDEDFVEVVMERTDGRGADLALDSIGATMLDRTFDAVRLLGHVINIGEAEGKPFDNLRDRILPRSISFTRFSITHVIPDARLWKRGLDYTVQGIQEGWLNIPIVNAIPLDNVRDMHRQMESRQIAGKLLLSMNW